MKRGYWMIPVIVVLAGCGTKEGEPSADNGLRSDVELKSAAFYMEHRDALAEMDAICTDWKGSQRPPMSWPSVVVNNCNNVDTAKTAIQNKSETDKLRREGAI